MNDNEQNKEKGSKTKKRKITEIGAAVLILAAVILLKIALGEKFNPGSANDAPTIFDIYQIEIPAFDGEHYVIDIQHGEAFFKPGEIVQEYYTHLSELDQYGRASFAMMCADEPHIQTGERGAISDLKPSGWRGGGFYHRSHLLMWKLSGLDEIENLITGTATFNQKYMQEYERQVTGYLWEHKENHVMYRVTPYYVDNEPVCRGVLMEAYSVEDDGELEFCVFVYNVEPGAVIDYATGDYMENAENMTEPRPEE